jgi:hypothetical protein
MGKRGPARGTGGRPRKSLDEKILDGKPATVIKKPPKPKSEYPEPSEFLLSAQRLEIPLKAKSVYVRVYSWLKQYNCESLITQDIVELYALCVARYVQCEEAVSKVGFTGKHPTTGMPIASPYVAMSREYMKQAMSVWDRINGVVRENASGDYASTAPSLDVMEMLLRENE